jgi:nitroreductase
MDYEGFLELIKKRRSIRKFKEIPVKDDDIQKIVETIRYAPSGMNSQPWELIVVKKSESKDIVAGFILKAMEEAMKNRPSLPDGKRPQPPTGFAKAPVFILIFSDNRTKNFLPPTDEERSKYLTFSNLAIGFHNMLLAATTLGLGAHWISIISNPPVSSRVKKHFNIPDSMQLYAMMALGYPDMAPAPKKMRDTHEIVHYDDSGYFKFRSDKELKEFFAP